MTKDVDVPPTEIAQYYQENQASYGTPESRVVRHILVAEKDGDTVDFDKSKEEADRLYAELQDGADFAALAKAESADTTSAVRGGRLEIRRGETVPEFDKMSFDLEQGTVSKPVRTTYGYHIIEALSAGPEGQDDAALEGARVDQGDAAAGEADRRHDAVDRGSRVRLREQGHVRVGLRAARAPRGHEHRDGRRDRVGSRSMSLAEALLDLQELTRRLRRDCPWDREQTARTIVPHTVEEAYEVADAAVSRRPCRAGGRAR